MKGKFSIHLLKTGLVRSSCIYCLAEDRRLAVDTVVHYSNIILSLSEVFLCD
jgi:hypothetical protein